MIDDPGFPGLHIRPPRGWLNDPNGLALIDGCYHVFFQYNAERPLHGSITWGHASSTDLITWRYLPTALINRPGMIDEAGCWSGCVVDDHGVPTAVYTAVRDRPSDAVVAVARSDRNLEVWQQPEVGVIGPPADPSLTETRDPYVFTVEGRRYAVQGTGGAHAEPAILLYGCDDLDHWTELGRLLDYRNGLARELAEATSWECPNLFPLEDQWVLVLSCWRRAELTSVYLIGDLEPDGTGLRFVPRSGGPVDQSPVFYAPQVLTTDERVLIWGWAREIDRSDEELLRAGWAGALTFPRELRIDGDRLVSAPAAELDRLRGTELPTDRPITQHSFEIQGDAGVRLDLITGENRVMVVDEPEAARVLVDGSLIEIFTAADPPRTVRAYPTNSSVWHAAGPDPAALVINKLALPD